VAQRRRMHEWAQRAEVQHIANEEHDNPYADTLVLLPRVSYRVPHTSLLPYFAQQMLYRLFCF